MRESEFPPKLLKTLGSKFSSMLTHFGSGGEAFTLSFSRELSSREVDELAKLLNVQRYKILTPNEVSSEHENTYIIEESNNRNGTMRRVPEKITIEKTVQIPGTNIILEAGDKIRILEGSSKDKALHIKSLLRTKVMYRRIAYRDIDQEITIAIGTNLSDKAEEKIYDKIYDILTTAGYEEGTDFVVAGDIGGSGIKFV